MKDIDSIIKVLTKLPKIRELDIEKNPCCKRFSYKYDIIWCVRLEKLDGEIIKESDYELAKTFKKEMA